MKYALIIGMFFLFISCQNNTVAENNKYFYDIDRKTIFIKGDLQKLTALQKGEADKYKKTKDEKYLLSSIYLKLFYQPTHIKQVPIVYNLLKLNNNRYDFLSISCYYNLAFQFENSSPQLAMKFIDDAIKTDLETQYYLSHLYHLKGRLYYNQEDYTKAKYYFTKALKSYKPKQKLYIASMYNNFGMVDDKLNNQYRP
ncbi:hypothetical protein [Chryseobacterium sediminis]|uniref:Tetratricopeptide repeat protein n=1 Tax=Chryseobacterium sediminis TaxID=1679494 RepID=A0A5B2TNN4_9FLAO|nr:hypothetical protein [Chryseobacterium sediminis]KAA2215693.1 hypothetical protein FW780_21500 [Chryseobacterium sediminis]